MTCPIQAEGSRLDESDHDRGRHIPVGRINHGRYSIARWFERSLSADFPWADHRTYPIACGRWRVASYVDSENAFGAKIRNHWTAEVHWIP